MSRPRPIYRCGATIEALPSGVRVRMCRRRVIRFGVECWQHRKALALQREAKP